MPPQPRPAAENTDCPVATLLAMTVGRPVLAPYSLAAADTSPPSAHPRAKRPCTLPPSACHCEPVQKWEPGRTCAARRRRCSGVTETWLFSGKAGAKDTQLVSPRCGNPHPRRETWQAGNCSGKSVPPTNSPKVLLFPPPTARSTDCRVAPLLAMTCRAGFSQCKYALARQFPRFHGPCIRSPLLVHPTPNPGSGGKIRLTPFPRHFIIGKNDLPLWRKEF